MRKIKTNVCTGFMKKILSMAVGAVMLLSVCSCGDGKNVKYAEAPEKVNTERGVWNDNVYNGAFTDLSFTLPSGWEVLSDEELREYINMPDGLVYDMMCQNNATGSNVAVIYEDLLETFGSNSISEEDYLESVSSNLESMGFYVSDSEKKELGKHEFTVIRAYGESEDLTVDQYSFVRKEKGYMISVIVTATGGDAYENIERNFG